jgi:hypothetical protein
MKCSAEFIKLRLKCLRINSQQTRKPKAGEIIGFFGQRLDLDAPVTKVLAGDL